MRSRTNLFRDRTDAGRQLAERLFDLPHEQPIVLGLARGGVVVAAEIARVLEAPLDVVVARKIGAPFQPELGIGAVAPGGVRILDETLIDHLHVSRHELDRITEHEIAEIERRLDEYRDGPPIDVSGRTVILVDDGLATGVTALAAVRYLRTLSPKRIVAAFPVASSQGLSAVGAIADDVVCCAVPPDMAAVGLWYADFGQVEDDQVIHCLREFGSHGCAAVREVEILAGGARLKGDLTLPAEAKAVVAFAHGSGSSRLSPRNRFVAEVLNDKGLGTLLIDLLTAEEEAEDRWSGKYRFDIDVLSERMSAVINWLDNEPACHGLPIGLFGASTGAAAALVAASKSPQVKAVVSRGGRPDLAGGSLRQVTAPTLLIVGSRDDACLPLNRDALEELGSPIKSLQLVEAATHLFEEPGAIEVVSKLSCDWLKAHLI